MVRIRSFSLYLRSGLNILTDYRTEVYDTSLEMSAFLDYDTRKEDAVLNGSTLLDDDRLGSYQDYTNILLIKLHQNLYKIYPLPSFSTSLFISFMNC